MRTIVLACALVLVGAASAQELGPTNYSPTDDVPIKVTGVAKSSYGTRFLVSVGNRSDSAITARIGCSMYDDAGTALGSAKAAVEAVPPASEVVEEFDEPVAGVTAVFCRVVGFRKTN